MRHVKAVILRVRGFEPPPLLLFRFRYGVVGNMSGFHPVASGSIPGIGLRRACEISWEESIFYLFLDIAQW